VLVSVTDYLHQHSANYNVTLKISLELFCSEDEIVNKLSVSLESSSYSDSEKSEAPTFFCRMWLAEYDQHPSHLHKQNQTPNRHLKWPKWRAASFNENCISVRTCTNYNTHYLLNKNRTRTKVSANQNESIARAANSN